jgi:hypothetical protein
MLAVTVSLQPLVIMLLQVAVWVATISEQEPLRTFSELATPAVRVAVVVLQTAWPVQEFPQREIMVERALLRLVAVVAVHKRLEMPTAMVTAETVLNLR